MFVQLLVKLMPREEIVEVGAYALLEFSLFFDIIIVVIAQ